jgi:hypothetical protein
MTERALDVCQQLLAMRPGNIFFIKLYMFQRGSYWIAQNRAPYRPDLGEVSYQPNTEY